MALRRVFGFVSVVLAKMRLWFGSGVAAEAAEVAAEAGDLAGGGVEDLFPAEVFRGEPQARGEEVVMVVDETESLDEVRSDNQVPEVDPVVPARRTVLGEREDPQFAELAQPEAGPVEVPVPEMALVLPEVGPVFPVVDLVLPDLHQGHDEEVIPTDVVPAPAPRRFSRRTRRPPERLQVIWGTKRY
ncbi:uncharacterized protein LOC123533427 [Mercenaria mercenaria]|uniref:uncharacterized protein LOC123533427 n=1 Tax=Mercenaria mercenaria TaxID=6596 RepID=UPI00234E753D|nr:uncharacterized protein LOC123533427 [Mercenaria mercenaria]